MTTVSERQPGDPCGLDGVCSSCREPDLTPTGADPVDDALAGRRRRHRAPQEWDTPLYDAVAAAFASAAQAIEQAVPSDEGPEPDDPPDPEEFCDACLAGTESSQHQARCLEGGRA